MPDQEKNSSLSKREEDSAPGRYLKNPLPVPRRKKHVRMDFDLVDDWDISPEMEFFDIDIEENDDFDI